MAVGLTIGLAVSTRSLTDVNLSTRVEESSRAFSAAEAGIEQILEQNLATVTTGTSGSVGSGGQSADYNVNLVDVNPGASPYLFPGIIPEGESQVVWLVPHNSGTGTFDDSSRDYTPNLINICWQDFTLPLGTYTALDLTVFFKEGADYKVARIAYDPNSSRAANTGFTNSGISSGTYCVVGTQRHRYQVLLDMTTLSPSIGAAAIPIAIRLRPVYVDSRLAVQPVGDNLPVQGKTIQSTGDTASGVSRRWDVLNTYAAPQDIFDYALWSDTDINKPLL